MNKIYNYRVTLKQQILVLLTFFEINGFIVLGASYLFGLGRIVSAYPELIFVYMILFILPTLLLHIQYLIKNGAAEIVINTDEKIIVYQTKNEKYEYSFNQIVNLKYVATSGHISKKGRWEVYPFDSYRFYKISLKDGKKFFVTCLMVNDIENTFEQILGQEAERKFRALPFLY